MNKKTGSAIIISAIFLFCLFAFLPFAQGQEKNSTLPNLTININSGDQRNIEYSIDFRPLPSENYTQYIILVPLPTDHLVYSDRGIICAWENVYNKYTVIFVVVPPNQKSQISLSFVSMPIIAETAAGNLIKSRFWA
jgi:hypothetical protein